MTAALEVIRHALLLGVAVACAYTDLAKGKLYNVCTITGLMLGFAVSFMLDGAAVGYPNLVASGVACALGIGLVFLAYLFGGLGGGDVKMMAAVGALSASWRLTAIAAIYAALVGAAWAVCVLIWQGRLLEGLRSSLRLLLTLGRRPNGKEETERSAKIPFGAAIAVGAIAAWFEYYVIL